MDQDKYLPELLAEKESLDPSFVHAMRLLAEGTGISSCTLSLGCTPPIRHAAPEITMHYCFFVLLFVLHEIVTDDITSSRVYTKMQCVLSPS